MADVSSLEESARHYLAISIKEWEIELSADDLIDLVFNEVGECLAGFDQSRAERSVKIVLHTLYYFQHGRENKALKKIKDAARDHEKSVKKKVRRLKDILWEDGHDVERLHDILDDMLESPYRYAKLPKTIPEAELSREYAKDTIIMALSVRLDCRLCVRKAGRLIDKLDEKYDSLMKDAARTKFQ